MKFAIGYQQPENGEPFCDIVRDYRAAVAEVYFPWVGMASGRNALGATDRGTDWTAQAELEENLKEIKSTGVQLDLLLNANCYGADAVSRKLENEIGSLLDYLHYKEIAPEIVTTASPFVAAAVKKLHPQTEVRASVNMRLDSTTALGYLADTFDSFHIRRDLQRDLATVARFHAWCEANGKKLCMLANSGCLRNCPAQSFHDNLVAHHAEVTATRNIRDYIPHLCWKLYRNCGNLVEFLRATWIRPEDIGLYEKYFSVVKLATRTHSNPRTVIGAYAAGRFTGNLADLTEPCFSHAFAPCAIDNTKFPAGWMTDTAGACATHCSGCGKCGELLARVLVQIPPEVSGA